MKKNHIHKMIKGLLGLKGLMTVLFIVLVCVVSFVLRMDTCEDWIKCLVGAYGISYCLYWILIWFFCPIKRDLMLMKGSAFIWRVIFFVILVPFSCVLLLLFFEGRNFKAQELIYAPELTECDSIKIPKHIPDFKSNVEIISSSKNDTLLLHVHDVALLDSISKEHKEKLLTNPSLWSAIFHVDVMRIDTLTENNINYINVVYRKGLDADAISEQKNPSLLWAVFYHFVDPGNQHMTTTNKGRTLALIIALLGVVLMNGLLVSTIINWIDRRKERWTKGEVRYGFCSLFLKKYAVVIGANETAPTIIKKLINGHGEKANLDYVILLTNGEVEEVRRKVDSYLEDVERKRLIIYSGQLDSIEEIYKLRIKHATEIYVLGENSEDKDSYSYHDTQNMKCVHNIASYLTDRCVGRKIICRVLFEYQTTFSVFQFSEIPEKIRQHLVFIPFNNYENWAQRVLVTGEYTEIVKKVLPMQQKTDFVPTFSNKVKHFIVNTIQAYMTKKNDEERRIEYLPLEGNNGMPEFEIRNGEKIKSNKYVHFVIVGMSKMGVAMAIQAAQVAHFPNFKVKDEKPLRTRITFIDPNADNEMNFFKGRYQHLFDMSRSRFMDATTGKDNGWEDPISDPLSPYHYLGPNFIDIEWEFIKGNVELPSVRKYLELVSDKNSNREKGNSILTIAVCLPLAHEAIAASLYMPATVYDYAQQIWVYQREASDIVFNLYYEENNQNKKYEKLRPFGMQNADFTMDKDNYYRAQLCNYVYELMFDGSISNNVINEKIAAIEDVLNKDAMQSARDKWKKLSIFNRWSNRYLANSFETKVRSVGGLLANYSIHYKNICDLFDAHADMLAECEHNRWNVQQLLMGFRAYTYDENNEFGKCTDKKGFKDKLKRGKEKAHLNICSFDYLDIVDREAKKYDKIFNHAIPIILKLTEKAKISLKKNDKDKSN